VTAKTDSEADHSFMELAATRIVRELRVPSVSTADAHFQQVDLESQLLRG
jgi:hypothetical protein